MGSGGDDVIGLVDHAWRRLDQRLDGLADAEWSWCPTADERIGLRWRLRHIAELLTEPRTAAWMGVTARTDSPDATRSADPRPAISAADATAEVSGAYRGWRAVLAGADLGAPVGAAAGRWATASRLSFALHIADEFVHHAAEVALLRDLYAAGPVLESCINARELHQAPGEPEA